MTALSAVSVNACLYETSELIYAIILPLKDNNVIYITNNNSFVLILTNDFECDKRGGDWIVCLSKLWSNNWAVGSIGEAYASVPKLIMQN